MTDAVPTPHRLESLDALRGFDMVWIVGGAAIFETWAEHSNAPWLHALAQQFTHVEWNGFRFWDLVFPLFLFIAGVAMPFALTRRLEQGASRGELAAKVVRRGLVLVLLGVVYNGLLSFDFSTLRYASVLGRIGLGYLFAGLIVLRWGVRGQVVWAGAILLGYWAALMLVPVPGYGAGDLTPGHTLTDWVDQELLPGRLHRGDRDPEGILSTVPAIATALLGALAGAWLRRTGPPSSRQSSRLAAAGLVALMIGGAWGVVFPINKNLWTSSFVLWAGGWSLLLLALFHQLVDVWGHRRLLFPFTVIGTNAITIYLLNRFVDFDAVSQLLLGGGRLAAPLVTAGALVLQWLLLWWLYRRRIFLRV